LRTLLGCETGNVTAVDYSLYQISEQFTALYPRLNCPDATELAVITEAEIEATIQSESNALFISPKQVDSDSLQQVEFVNEAGKTVSFEARTFISGEYPLASVYYLYADHSLLRDETLTAVNEFLDFTLQSSNQVLFDEYGFMPLPQQMNHRNKVQLDLEQAAFENGYK
jgi:hypothetical protein